MSFPRYPKYKPSGVEWLGEVPEHWDVKPIRKAARLESGHTPSRNHPEYWENCTVPWFTLADVWQIREAHRDVVFETKELISELGLANSAARRLPAGTVMLSRTASVGFSAIMGIEMATTQDFANWVCGGELLPNFLLHVFRSMQGEFRRLMMGSTHNTIYMPDIQAFRFALPSVPEQRAIAAFLDQETAKIDALIAEQEKLIELLAEKRQAVISHAVTKGLDPAAPMKPSGVEWLGEVPAHWTVKRLRWIGCSVQTGPFGSQLHADEYVTGGIPVINPINLVNGEIVPFEDVTVTDDVAARLPHQRLQSGDIVLARRGELGRCAVVSESETGWLCGTGSMVLRVQGTHLLPQYLARCISLPGTRHYLIQDSVGSVMESLDTTTVLNMPTALPPTPEQSTILYTLQSRVKRLDELTDHASNATDLLRERRSALISAAVTGQIDVRNVEPENAA